MKRTLFKAAKLLVLLAASSLLIGCGFVLEKTEVTTTTNAAAVVRAEGEKDKLSAQGKAITLEANQKALKSEQELAQAAQRFEEGTGNRVLANQLKGQIMRLLQPWIAVVGILLLLGLTITLVTWMGLHHLEKIQRLAFAGVPTVALGRVLEIRVPMAAQLGIVPNLPPVCSADPDATNTGLAQVEMVQALAGATAVAAPAMVVGQALATLRAALAGRTVPTTSTSTAVATVNSVDGEIREVPKPQ